MIASPCRNCPKCDQPKENCMKDCELLIKVQEIQRVSDSQIILSGIDYAEVGRFTFAGGVQLGV